MHGIKAFRFLLLLVAVLLYFGHRSESVLVASSNSAIVSIAAVGARANPAREAWCDDTNICNDTVDCNTFCVNRDVFPQEYITCGDFYDGWQDGYCEDQCGNPLSCEDYETFENCPSDCGECGDDVCQTYYESYGTCLNDCGGCGDGVCQGSHENCNSCDDDCNPGNITCGGSSPGSDDGCDEDEVQNGEGYCCPVNSFWPADGGGPTSACASACSSNEACIEIYALGTIGWGCVGKGSTCGS